MAAHRPSWQTPGRTCASSACARARAQHGGIRAWMRAHVGGSVQHVVDVEGPDVVREDAEQSHALKPHRVP